MNKQERLNKAYDFLKYEKVIKKQEDVAKAMGATQSNVSGALNGRESVLTDNFLIRFADAFKQISLPWLLKGEGQMLNVATPEFNSENTPQVLGNAENVTEQPARRTQDSHVGVPYYNVDFELGFDFMANDQTVSPEYMIDCVPYNKCDAWCNAWGDSMRPTISSGDIIALKEVRDPKSCLINNDIYAIVTTNELRTIKRVKDNGSTLTLIPDNKECQEQIIDKELLLKVYRVMGTMKRF